MICQIKKNLIWPPPFKWGGPQKKIMKLSNSISSSNFKSLRFALSMVIKSSALLLNVPIINRNIHENWRAKYHLISRFRVFTEDQPNINNANLLDLHKAGVYKIVCLKNGKTYIGQTKTFLKRTSLHIHSLESNKHDCFELQKDWNHYGSQHFKIEILNADKSFHNDQKLLIEGEKKYLQEFLDNNVPLYNITTGILQTKQIAKYTLQISYKNKIYTRYAQVQKALNADRTKMGLEKIKYTTFPRNI